MDRTKRTPWLALAAAAVAIAGCARGGNPFTLVSVDDVERMLAKPDVAIVDANTLETFRRNHLPGARYWRSAPLATLLPADRSAPVVFYCASPA